MRSPGSSFLKSFPQPQRASRCAGQISANRMEVMNEWRPILQVLATRPAARHFEQRFSEIQPRLKGMWQTWHGISGAAAVRAAFRSPQIRKLSTLIERLQKR